MNKSVWLGVIVWLGLMAGGYYYYTKSQTEDDATAVVKSEPSKVANSAQNSRFEESGPPKYPVPQPRKQPAPAPQVAEPAPRPAAPQQDAEPQPEPLPALQDSDPQIEQGLARIAGREPIERFLVPNRIIERLVVWLNSLDGEAIPLRFRPLHHTPGLFEVAKQGDAYRIADSNTQRYDAQISVLQRVDVTSAVRMYLRYYPLFQEAYSDLGHSGAHFNDRVIQLIDHLLAAPEIEGPIRLVRPKVQYRFADPGLQSLSSGHKAMIRIGPEHAQEVKRKLRQLRAEILRQIAAEGA